MPVPSSIWLYDDGGRDIKGFLMFMIVRAVLRSSDVDSSRMERTPNPTYVRFDATVAGKEATDLISRCQKAVDEDQKVLLGFTLSNLTSDIFTLNKGDHAGEQRVSLKARLIKVDWIKIGQAMVYKAEKSEAPIPTQTETKQHYAENSF